MRSNRQHNEFFAKIYEDFYQVVTNQYNLEIKRNLYMTLRYSPIYGSTTGTPTIKIKYLKNVKDDHVSFVRLELVIDASKQLFEANVDENIAFNVLEILDSNNLKGKLKIINTESSIKKIGVLYNTTSETLVDDMAADFFGLYKIMQYIYPYL